MILYKTKEITLAANAEDVIKDFSDLFFSLVISNKTDNAIEILFDTQYETVETGLVITNQSVVFDKYDCPENKVRVKNLSNNEVKITILWSN